MIGHWLQRQLHKTFPEQRLFLRSDTETRYMRIPPMTQFVAVTGSAMVLGWSIMATAIILMDALGAGSLREQALREQRIYEERLNNLSAERDLRSSELADAHARFETALAEVSAMQSRLLASEERRKEVEKGLDVVQATLRKTMAERDAARNAETEAIARLAEETETVDPVLARARDVGPAIDYLAEALTVTARERDEMLAQTEAYRANIESMEFDIELTKERNDRIFSQIEEAVALSLTPLDEMFSGAGLPSDSIIDAVRQGYSGQGGPITPLIVSTKGEAPDADTLRANSLLSRLDELNLYRMAAQKTPFAEPVKGAYRFTSGFGPRRDPIHGGTRQHNGTDFAARHGAPIYATADGVVIQAGWSSGYGRLIKIQHEFGFETRYAHLSRIRVNVGDRVSRGAHIGDMGNSGRSTGTHLHYEVRIGGDPVNPMTYIKAARDVF